MSKPKPVHRTPATQGKAETETVSRSPEKNLTEPVAKPGAARDERRTTEGAGAPLEKRKPKGDDNSALERKPGR